MQVLSLAQIKRMIAANHNFYSLAKVYLSLTINPKVIINYGDINSKNESIRSKPSQMKTTSTNTSPLQKTITGKQEVHQMKWIQDIKASTRPWLTFLSGFVTITPDEPDETAIINDYFVTYLQNIAADQIKLVSCETEQLKHETNEVPSQHPEKSLRTLSSIKQIG